MFVPTLLHATPLEYLSSYFVDLNSDCLAGGYHFIDTDSQADHVTLM